MGLDMWLFKGKVMEMPKQMSLEYFLTETSKEDHRIFFTDQFQSLPKPVSASHVEDIELKTDKIRARYNTDSFWVDGSSLVISDLNNDDNGRERIKLRELIACGLAEITEKDYVFIEYDEHELLYWRKANQIRDWFARNLTDFQDNGTTIVTKQDLWKLKDDCDLVLNNHKLASQYLPTSEGFFFGSDEYDEYYFEDVKRTAREIKNICKLVEWDTEVLLYHEWY
ncbi:MAG: hypothetical protein LUD40_16495 [Phocaeicola dorei]|nr:hypothetical protein [Phocaeicola dorei]